MRALKNLWYPALLVLLGLVVGTAIVRTYFPREKEVVRYQYVHVTPEEFAKDEPDTTVTFPEKVVMPERKPAQVVVAPEAGKEDIAEFLGNIPEPRLELAADVQIINPVVMDSVRIMNAPKLIKSIVYRDNRLDLNTLTADGDKVRFTYEGIRPPFEVVMNGPEPLVQSSRFWLLREVKDHAVVGGIMLGVGIVAGLVLAN